MALENNQRESFRAPVVELYEGTLHFGEAEIRVRMINESATGFKLATDDPRPLPKMQQARLVMEDGVRHEVLIRHVQREGELRTLGVQRVSTRVSGPAGAEPAERRSRGISIKKKVAVGVLLTIAAACAWQAATAHHKPAARSSPPPVPKLDREHPFDFRRYLNDDAADWLRLSNAQRPLIRNLLNVCGVARDNRLAPAQRAFVDFAAEASMLKLLHVEQRTALEKELDRPFSGSALLIDVLHRYLPHASRDELSQKFGALMFVSPELARNGDVPDDVAAAIRSLIDQAVEPSVADGASDDAEQMVLDFSLRVLQLEARCRELIGRDTATSNPTQPSSTQPASTKPASTKPAPTGAEQSTPARPAP